MAGISVRREHESCLQFAGQQLTPRWRRIVVTQLVVENAEATMN